MHPWGNLLLCDWQVTSLNPEYFPIKHMQSLSVPILQYIWATQKKNNSLKKSLLHKEDLTPEDTTAYAVQMHSDFSGVAQKLFLHIFLGDTFEYGKLV